MADEKETTKTDEDIEVVMEEGGTDPSAAIKKLKERIKLCETERKEYLEGWQRAKADYINYKNEDGKRMEDMARFITAGFIQEILPVLDSFDLALGHGVPAEVEKGILLIRSQLEDILRKRGLEQIKIKPGEKFNPEKHESLGETEADFPEGTIAEEVQKGYLLREKVLRPVRVRLSKKPPN